MTTDKAIDAVTRLADSAERWAEGDSNRDAVPAVHEDRDDVIWHIREAAKSAEFRRKGAFAAMARDDAARDLIDAIAWPAGRDFARAWDRACFLFGRADASASLLASHTAAAVEREMERCAAYCEKRAADEKRDALACAEVSLSGCHDVGAYDRGRIEALRDAASALRSRPPRAGAEATNATREARPRCTTCGDSGWSIDDESNRRRCSCAAAGRGEVGRG